MVFTDQLQLHQCYKMSAVIKLKIAGLCVLQQYRYSQRPSVATKESQNVNSSHSADLDVSQPALVDRVGEIWQVLISPYCAFWIFYAQLISSK